MNEGTNPTQLLITNRVADFLLCTFEPLVFFATVANCVLAFKTPEEIEQLKADLLNDPFDRFVFTEENDGALLIGLKYLTEAGRRIQQAVEGWRVRILHFLERSKSPVELGRIAVHVSRPDNIPNSFKLKDILNADKLGRFSVHGSVDRLLVSRNLSAEEMEQSRQLWRDQNHDFLFAQPRDVTLAVLGNNVPRPANLPKHDNKLIEVLSTDPERRFFFIQRSPAETMVRVKLTEIQYEQLSEVWRVKVGNYLLAKGCAVLLSEVSANVKRPSIHFNPATTLREVLLEDPHRRFQLFGHGLVLQVALMAQARMVPELLPSPPPVLPLHKGFNNNKVGASGDCRGPQPAVPTQIHHSARSVEMATTAETNGMRFGAPSLRLTQSAPLPRLPPRPRYSLQKPPQTVDFPFASASNTPSHSVFKDPKDWDIVEEAQRLKNLSDDFSDLFRLPPRIETPPLSSPFLGAVVAASPSAATMRPAEAHNDRPLSIAPDLSPGHLSSPMPAPLTEPLMPTECSPLSMSPDSVLHSPSSSSNPSKSSSTRKKSVDTLLSEWLPVVLTGFDASLIDAAISNLREEGFASVRDLVVTKSLGQLSPDYLAQLGLKMGHCNRIFAQLPAKI